MLEILGSGKSPRTSDTAEGFPFQTLTSSTSWTLEKRWVEIAHERLQIVQSAECVERDKLKASRAKFELYGVEDRPVFYELSVKNKILVCM
jgi:hypothetical protein